MKAEDGQKDQKLDFFSVLVVLIIYLSREDDSRVNVVGSHDHIPLSLRAVLCFLPWEVWRCILCV